MPWKVTNKMKQRIEFVIRATSGCETITDLCQEFNVSRTVGHDWLNRYRDAKGNLNSLADRSRRPHCSPNKTELTIEENVISLRNQYGWGGEVFSLPGGAGVGRLLTT